jgi:hypothetical protein
MLRHEKRPFPIVAYNGIFKALRLSPRLDFDQIIKRARKNTGLKDLGDDFYDLALRLQIESINNEAMLHPFGVLMIREKIISQLENRLWAEYWLMKHPGILGQDVLPVVLITGLQRTGTTKMQRLLSELRGARPLRSWEALYPAPVGEVTETKRRISRTTRNEKALKWISPAFQSIHPVFTHEPEEDVLLLDVHFMSSSTEAILNVPSYADWLSTQDHSQAYEYERKLLKLLQWQQGGDFWVLKSPHHLEYLDVIEKVFPDTKIIWMHRPIEDCIPSFLSMLYYSRLLFSDKVDQDAIVSQWINKLTKMLQSGLKFRAMHSNKIIDVFFEDFLKSESAVVGKIVRDLSLTQVPMSHAGDGGKKRYLSKHRYSLEDWGLKISELHTQFDFYHKAIFGNSLLKRSHEH